MTCKLIVKEQDGAKIHEFDSMGALSEQLKRIFQESTCPSEITMIDHNPSGDMIVRVEYAE